jgi:hypothetical protein
MKDAWLKTLKEVGEKEERENVLDVKTDSLVAGFALFFSRINGRLEPLYANDIYYSGGLSTEHLNKVLDMRFGSLLLLAIPDLYKYFANKYIPDEERIKKMNITFNDLAEEAFDWIK